MRRCHFLSRIIEALFFHLHVGVRCHTGLSSVSPFPSCSNRNSHERKKERKKTTIVTKDPAELGRAALKLQATTASWLWSARLSLWKSGKGGRCSCCWKCCHRLNPICTSVLTNRTDLRVFGRFVGMWEMAMEILTCLS